MMDPVINLTSVLVSEFEKIDSRLDQMLENVDDLMARDQTTSTVFGRIVRQSDGVRMDFRSLTARYPDMIDKESYDEIYAEDYLDQYSDRL